MTRSLMDVAPRAMSWIWQSWIPRGSLSLVLGEPGVGKSLYALQLAAMVTRGWQTAPLSAAQKDLTQETPDGPVPEMRGTVVLFEAGDSASILRSRLDAAGADVARIVLVDRNEDGESSEEDVEEFLEPDRSEPVKRSGRVDKDRELRRDLDSLEMHVLHLRRTGHDVSLIIIDPIESLLRDSRDKHRLARQLSELADSLNVAIVAVGTTSSTPRAYPGLRLDGKGIDALFKMSKSVVTVVRDLEDDQQRIVLPTKLNLSATPPGLIFAFTGDGNLNWNQVTASLTGQDDLAQARNLSKQAPERQRASELGRAMTWLEERLQDGGVLVTTVRSDAKEQGISKASLRRAYDQLGCVSKKGLGSGQWVWRLPESVNAENSDIAASQETESWECHERTREVDAVSTC